jgi:hypothetical protein
MLHYIENPLYFFFFSLVKKDVARLLGVAVIPRERRNRPGM